MRLCFIPSASLCGGLNHSDAFAAPLGAFSHVCIAGFGDPLWQAEAAPVESQEDPSQARDTAAPIHVGGCGKDPMSFGTYLASAQGGLGYTLCQAACWPRCFHLQGLQAVEQEKQMAALQEPLAGWTSGRGHLVEFYP